MYGIDTRRCVPLKELEISSKNKKAGKLYQPTRGRAFKRLMQNIQFPNNSVFVDVGCGKGRIVMLASICGFPKVRGIEFSKELCLIARQNIETLRHKKLLNGIVEIVECDAANYEIQEDENVFFFFYPFTAEIMGVFLHNLRKSLQQKPRMIWLIYFYLTSSKVVNAIQAANFVREEDYCYGSAKFDIFTNGNEYP